MKNHPRRNTWTGHSGASEEHTAYRALSADHPGLPTMHLLRHPKQMHFLAQRANRSSRKTVFRSAQTTTMRPTKNKTPRDRDLLGFSRHCWRRRRDSNPRSRFWPRCSLSRGVPSTSRPRLPNFRSRRESARRSQDNSGLNGEGQCLPDIFCARLVNADAICSHGRSTTNGALF